MELGQKHHLPMPSKLSMHFRCGVGKEVQQGQRNPNCKREIIVYETSEMHGLASLAVHISVLNSKTEMANLIRMFVRKIRSRNSSNASIFDRFLLGKITGKYLC